MLSGNQVFGQNNRTDTLSINYSCLSSNRVNFSATAPSSATNLSWNFGDTTSGDLNSATGITSEHIFKSSGEYIITLSTTAHNGETLKQIQQIYIIDVTGTWENNTACYSDNYTHDTKITGSNNHYDIIYEWIGIPSFTRTWSTDTLPYVHSGDFGYGISGSFKETVIGKNTCTATVYYSLSQSPPPLSHTTAITSSICSINNGAITLTESGGTPPYTYAWSPNVSTNSTAVNLSAGYYFINVKDANDCTENMTVIVHKNEGDIKHEQTVKQPLCTANGSIQINPSGGTAPYNYLWMPDVSTFSSAKNLAAGVYNIALTDKNGCSEKFDVKLQLQSTSLEVHTNVTTPECGTANGNITLQPVNGTAPYKYTWDTPVISNAATAYNLTTGTYKATVTDADRCTGAVSTTLSQLPLTASLGKDTFLCTGNTITLSPGSFSSYSWNDFSTQPVLRVNTPGTYSVIVSNTSGCTAKASVLVEGGCGNVFFPTAFTPNGDLKNDLFGPVGTLSKIKNYSLQVYNRFGNFIFHSENPYQKWNGKVNEKTLTGTYVYIASFEIDGAKRIQKGTITLVL